MPDEISIYHVNITVDADSDLTGIVARIQNDSPRVAIIIFERLERKIYSLATMPERGRIVPEMLEYYGDTYREIIESPWRIIYKIINDEVRIVSVIDERRNVKEVLLEKLNR
jgi:plasmid stabilization system protein ParE